VLFVGSVEPCLGRPKQPVGGETSSNDPLSLVLTAANRASQIPLDFVRTDVRLQA